jgi:peroxiredoxin
MPRVSLNQTAPDFSLPKFSGEPFRLSDLQRRRHVLLVFNRTFA